MARTPDHSVYLDTEELRQFMHAKIRGPIKEWRNRGKIGLPGPLHGLRQRMQASHLSGFEHFEPLFGEAFRSDRKWLLAPLIAYNLATFAGDTEQQTKIRDLITSFYLNTPDSKTVEGVDRYSLLGEETSPRQRASMRPGHLPKGVRLLSETLEHSPKLTPDLVFSLLSGDLDTEFRPQMRLVQFERDLLKKAAEYGLPTLAASLPLLLTEIAKYAPELRPETVNIGPLVIGLLGLMAGYGVSKVGTKIAEHGRGFELPKGTKQGLTRLSTLATGSVSTAAAVHDNVIWNVDGTDLTTVPAEAVSSLVLFYLTNRLAHAVMDTTVGDHRRKLAELQKQGSTKLTEMGRSSKWAYPAILDSLLRKVWQPGPDQKPPGLSDATYIGHYQRLFSAFGFDVNHLFIRDALSARPTNLEDSETNEVADLLVTEDGWPSLSETLLKLTLVEAARYKHIMGREIIPSPSRNAAPVIKELGEQRLGLVKKFSSTDPLSALMLALPAVNRFSYPELGISSEGQLISAASDARLFGSRAGRKDGNSGNTGFLPVVMMRYWQRIFNRGPESYLDATLRQFTDHFDAGASADYRNLASEIIASPLSHQAVSVIGMFSHGNTEEGAHGADKHTTKAAVADINEKLRENPNHLFYLLCSVSSLEYYKKFAAGLRGIYGRPGNEETQQLMGRSIDNMTTVQKTIVESLFRHFIQNRVGLITEKGAAAEDVAKQDVLNKQMALFLTWVMAENPELLEGNVSRLTESLYSRSGQVGMGEPHSLSFLFTVYFVHKKAKEMGITGHRFFRSVSALANHITGDTLFANLGWTGERAFNNQLTKPEIDNAAVTFNVGLSMTDTEDQLCELLLKTDEHLDALGDQVDEVAEQRQNNTTISAERYRAETFLVCARQILLMAERDPRFAPALSANPTLKTVADKIEDFRKRLGIRELELRAGQVIFNPANSAPFPTGRP